MPPTMAYLEGTDARLIADPSAPLATLRETRRPSGIRRAMRASLPLSLALSVRAIQYYQRNPNG